MIFKKAHMTIFNIFIFDIKQFSILLYNSYILQLITIIYVIKLLIFLYKTNKIKYSYYKNIHNQIPCYTFVNTKGGVGKTSIIYMLTYYISQCNIDVLLIDCSSSQDLSLLSVCSKKYAHIPTINEIITKLNKGYSPSKISDISLLVNTKKSNVYLITNDKKSHRNIVKNAILFLNKLNHLYRKKKFVVLIDTDSCIFHNLTYFAILLSNTIIIPTIVDLQYIKQINHIINYINYINKNNIFAIKNVAIIFNNLKMTRKIKSCISNYTNIPFTISKKNNNELLSIYKYLKNVYVDSMPEIVYIRSGTFIFNELKLLDTKKDILSNEIINDLQICMNKIIKLKY